MQTSAPTYLGLDLAWGERNRSGVVRLERDRFGVLTACDAQTLRSDSDILTWLDEHSGPGPTIVAIDAPIIAPNPPRSGRPVDRETTRRFGRFHAGAYPGNSVKCERPIKLAQALELKGWSLDPGEAVHGSGRYAIEVYPHAATIGLFRLDQIVKYKKGRVGDKQAGLARLQGLMHQHLPQLTPPIRPFPVEDPSVLRGRALKDLEDRLDAVLCAAMAARLREATEHTRVLGDLEAGYIVVPKVA